MTLQGRVRSDEQLSGPSYQLACLGSFLVSVIYILFVPTDRSRPHEEKVEALAEILCRAGGESAAALFVLMGTLENSAHPKLLANTAKHCAFTRCGELNLFGIVDAQVALIEGELLAAT